MPAPALVSPAGGDTLPPGGLWAVAWEGRTNLPASFDLEWSLNASEAGTRQVDFSVGLPGDFGTRGHAPWQASDGAARSGRIDHGQRSSLVLPVEIVGDGQISFRYRVDSEQGYDRLQFLVDGQALLNVSGQTAWQTFSTSLSAGQHELVWRFSKDNTLSGGEDAAWIDDLQIEQASLAQWQAAELDPSRSVNGDVLWRVPTSASSDASLRVRTRVGAVVSPWTASGPLTIDQPTVVSLASFEAGVGQALVGWPALLALAGLLALGAGWGAMVVRRRD
jgi:hypothetical protein